MIAKPKVVLLLVLATLAFFRLYLGFSAGSLLGLEESDHQQHLIFEYHQQQRPQVGGGVKRTTGGGAGALVPEHKGWDLLMKHIDAAAEVGGGEEQQHLSAAPNGNKEVSPAREEESTNRFQDDCNLGMDSAAVRRRGGGQSSVEQQQGLVKEGSEKKEASNNSSGRLSDCAILGSYEAAQVLPVQGKGSSTAKSDGSSFFHQVRTYVGEIDVEDLKLALKKLLFPSRPKLGTYPDSQSGKVVSVKQDPPLGKDVHFFAVDGTLLNLLRWGRIVNDNDLDIGFTIDSISNGRQNTSAHYYELHERLAAAGIISPISERDRKNLYHRTKEVKPGRCKYRGSMMQCRPLIKKKSKTGGTASGDEYANVLYDFFGPDSLYHEKLSYPHFQTLEDFRPFRKCRAFDFGFPCPKDPKLVLEKFTVNVAGPGEAPKGSYEFQGCALYPKDKRDLTPRHLESIHRSVENLRHCGYPNLGDYYSQDSQVCLERRRELEQQS